MNLVVTQKLLLESTLALVALYNLEKKSRNQWWFGHIHRFRC